MRNGDVICTKITTKKTVEGEPTEVRRRDRETIVIKRRVTWIIGKIKNGHRLPETDKNQKYDGESKSTPEPTGVLNPKSQ